MESRSSRRKPRFRLQTLLVLVTVFCVVLGLVVRELHREHWRKQVAAEVRRLHGRVMYKHPDEHVATGVVNGWLRLFLGDKYFAQVSYVALRPRSEEDLDLLLAFPETTEVELGGDAVTDAALGQLIGFPQLERLALRDAIISQRGLKSLTEFPNLCSLSLLNCPLSDESVKSITELSNLRFLSFGNCSLSDESLKSLTELSNLQRLSFSNCSPSDEGLKSLTELPNLQGLSFSSCSLSDSSLRSLYGARSSVVLSLNMTNVTEVGLLGIRDANPTWSVRFKIEDPHYVQPNGIVDENYLPSIQKLPQVKKLAFQGSLTSDATLAVLKGARSLDSLRLTRCRVSDDGLQHLRPLKNLTSLHIDATHADTTAITDEGMRALQGLTKLRGLSLFGTKIEGHGLEFLPPSIRSLNLLYSEVTDRGVASIAELTSLENLFLDSSRITDEGVDDLAKMTSLRRLRLWNTAISDAGFAQLQRDLPNCEIRTE